ncbi:5'-methylthioadenosine/S-adenosylhomocysteine nucleosidase family protein [Campylobacter canadensis]|uniref:5'-methylthioadenosine/S-adenosylhomocysteine nucleosidase n=1 Tax=Campylobacter canadensis TaxID=449520 RepID=A0ABS7WRZ6_9BACT|nr:5'-methylthioadenosine/S-adenosylhomocysteine nucleosidase [Campylobacter canadensis]MBZ7987525.1 5'-methylthioadenosine/S-adenosylhomocysteine nucleosidase [Campylobacter canadensis]MBZ7994868.1 5'-methylthioadenosine/S-adenosylhomocysteine nucleosidase [Campylobacter canadensis]MBZ7996348.1 5'-methylthioadenosine/S-adenosylhomocysteine nucleosidase [Campylobacter canadensis]MBZ7998381.1 5'-methylthioadenosine/S-adenosylhomocysteine nucleosidase [Campylobacter canadensis]MBZ8000096.1 5'-me
MKKFLLVVFLVNSLFAKILIQGAMPIEVDTLVANLKDKKETKVASYLFYEGKLNGKEVVIQRTLKGLTNAAAATAIAIERFHPSIIINQGTAGAIVEGLKFGTIVIGEKLYNAGSYRTDFSEYTINPLGRRPMKGPLELLDDNNQKQVNEYFTSDEKLVKKALEFGKKYKVQKAVIASADAFNKELLWLAYLNKTYNANVEEMESVAAAQVAFAYKIPFLSLRIMSDNMVERVEYDPKIAIKLQEFIIKFVKEL